MVLTDEQRRAVEAPPGPVRIVAGPGSGKTRVLTERIRFFVERGLFSARHILAVTFTVKATHEMRARLNSTLGGRAGALTIRTLHSLALSIVRSAPRRAGAPSQFDVGIAPARLESMLGDVLDGFAADPDFPQVLLDPSTAQQVIARLKHSAPERLLDSRYATEPEVRLVRAVDDRVHAAEVVTFDDLGVMALRAMTADRALAAAVRARYQAVFVDEYQDINKTQLELIRQLMRHGVITVVGDDDQCVYTWRGSDPSFLREFSADHGASMTQFLSVNFRCPSAVVEAANSVIARNSDRIPKSLSPARTDGSRLQVRRYATREAELDAATTEIAALIQRGVSPSVIGVLCRNNDLLQAFVLRMRSEGLPVQGPNPLRSTGGTALMSLLRAVSDGPGGPHFGNAINIGRRRIRKSVFRAIPVSSAPEPREIEAILRSWAEATPRDELKTPVLHFLASVGSARRDQAAMPPESVLSALYDRLELPRLPLRTPRPDGLEAAVALSIEVARQRGPTASPQAFQDVVMELEELRRADEGLEDAVNALTVHRAKGLEFENVLVLGVQGDTFPNLHFAEGDRELMEEERRLFYVALTRTKSAIVLSNHALLSAGTRQGPDKDGFLLELPPHVVSAE